MPLTFVVNQSVNLSATTGPDFGITSNTCSGSLSPAAPGSAPNTCQVFVRFTPTRPGLRSAPVSLTDSISGKTILQGLQALATGSLSVFTPGTVNTIASTLAAPTAVAVDSTGNAYVLEAGTASGTADLLLLPAGGGAPQIVIPQGAGLLTPSALAIDSAGNYYIADATQGTISRFGADGTINTSYVTGLDTPTAIYADGFDNLFIAQAGTTHNVIEVYAAGSRRIISSSFVSPSGLFLDLNGILYIADAGGHLVYAVDKSGILHEVAGNGTTTTTVPGQATGTGLLAPSSLSVDAAGDLYIADAAANRVYTVYASTLSNGSNIAVIFGTGAAGNAGDGGFSTLAQVSDPVSVAVDGSSNLFVVDSGNSSVREITYPNPTLAFGTIMVGQSSPVMLQGLSNFGTDNLNLTSAISTSDSHYTIDSNSTTCGTTIIAGSTCNVGVIFTPTANPLTASITLVSNSYNSPQPLQLTGTGHLVSPLQFTLPAQTEVYGQPFPEIVQVTNDNPAPTGTITFSIGKQVSAPSPRRLGPQRRATLLTAAFLSAPTRSPSAIPAIATTLRRPAPSYSRSHRPHSLSQSTTPPAYTERRTQPLQAHSAAYSPATRFWSLTPRLRPSSARSATIPSSRLSVRPAAPTSLTTPSPILLGPSPSRRRPSQINVNNATRQYGQANPSFTGTASGALNGDTFTITYSTTATVTSPVGTYPISATVSGPSSGNYLVTLISGTSPSHRRRSRSRSATRPGHTAQLIQRSPALSRRANGDTFTNDYSTTANVTSPVGTYPIYDVVGGPAASNYTIQITPGTLTITTAAIALNVTANNATRPYGAANPAFTSTITGALNGDTFTITYATTATATSSIGTYPIVATVSGSATGNYNVTTSNGVLTVTPATLTVTANNATRSYGTANPVFTGHHRRAGQR